MSWESRISAKVDGDRKNKNKNRYSRKINTIQWPVPSTVSYSIGPPSGTTRSEKLLQKRCVVVKKTQSQMLRVDADNALRVFHPRELQRVRHPTGIGLIIIAADHRRGDGCPNLNLMMMLGAHDGIAVRV